VTIWIDSTPISITPACVDPMGKRTPCVTNIAAKQDPAVE
jgi:hypothetical protein